MSADDQKAEWEKFYEAAGTRDPSEIGKLVGVEAASVERESRRAGVPDRWYRRAMEKNLSGRAAREGGAFRVTTTVEGPHVDWTEIMLGLGIKDPALARDFMAFYERMTKKALARRDQLIPEPTVVDTVGESKADGTGGRTK